MTAKSYRQSVDLALLHFEKPAGLLTQGQRWSKLPLCVPVHLYFIRGFCAQVLQQMRLLKLLSVFQLNLSVELTRFALKRVEASLGLGLLYHWSKVKLNHLKEHGLFFQYQAWNRSSVNFNEQSSAGWRLEWLVCILVIRSWRCVTLQEFTSDHLNVPGFHNLNNQSLI